MKNTVLIALVSLVVLSTACKSEFEKVRSSGNVNRIYEKALQYYENEEYQKAQTLFEIIISSFRGKQEAEEIYFKYAYTYYYLQQYILASYYFNNFSNTYATSDYRQEADFMAAYANYQLSPSFRLDQSYTRKAIDQLQLFVNTYPNSDKVQQCNQLIDAMRAKLELKAYKAAELYFNLREYQAAIQSFENVLKDFPDSDNVENIRYMVIRSAFLLAENSFVEKQFPRYKEAIELAQEFLARYDESRYRDEVQQMLDKSRDALNQLEDVRYQNESTGVRS
ncbi:MAG: outer membrane protein assembly factor BamD [Bacteroidetes bacterium]|jgi:outer membrane protein assembly factor BamD|nr:outer membrane protein assembly factor BamD [Bacteroidota bacterium]